MNIFEEIKKRNADKSDKIALSIRLEDNTVRSYTYGQMLDTATLFSEVLEKSGILKADRVAIISESSPEWSIAYIAIAKLNATSVLLDASLDRKELLDLLEKSDVRCLLASPKSIEKLGKNIVVPVFDIFQPLGSPCLQVTDTALSETAVPASTLPDGENAASIIFSSGTTKKASGILHSHDSLIQSAQMCITSNKLVADDRFLAILPNSHIYGLVCQVVGPLLLGSATCFLEGLSSAALVGAFKNFQPSIFPAVPKIYELLKSQILQKINSEEKTKKLFETVFPICLKLRNATKINLGKKLFKTVHDNFGGQLHILCSAGAPLSPETAEFFYGLGFDVLITYGATETCIPTIGNFVGHITTDTCGKPYPGIAVKIGENGEILIKTPYRMLGYFQDEESTAQAFDADGWFRSGDLGSIDEKGHIRVLGRCKENIVLATGKKIAPDDIEGSYSGINGIKELVICGIPVTDGSYDEVHAFFIAEVDQADSVLSQLKERSATLSQNKKLVGIHLVDEIPKTSLQKPKRYLLRQMIFQDQDIVSVVKPQPTIKDVPAIVLNAIARVSGIAASELSLSTRLFQELAIDSLGAIDLAYEIDEQCGTKVDHLLREDMTISELIDYAVSPVAGEQKLPDDPYPKRKRQLEYNIFCIVRNLFRSVYRVKVKNDAVLPENSGYIICANHVSYFDYLYLTLNFGKERFTKFCCMAKKELFQNNFLSRCIANICGMIPIDRTGLVADAMSTLRNKLKEKWGVLIHPEGTRSETGKMGTFKNGAAVLAIETGVPVVPAYIKGGYEVYPRGRKLPQLFDWKRMRKYQVEVIYGNPISPIGLSADELMTAILAEMTVLSNISKDEPLASIL